MNMNEENEVTVMHDLEACETATACNVSTEEDHFLAILRQRGVSNTTIQILASQNVGSDIIQLMSKQDFVEMGICRGDCIRIYHILQQEYGVPPQVSQQPASSLDTEQGASSLDSEQGASSITQQAADTENSRPITVSSEAEAVSQSPTPPTSTERLPKAKSYNKADKYAEGAGIPLPIFEADIEAALTSGLPFYRGTNLWNRFIRTCVNYYMFLADKEPTYDNLRGKGVYKQVGEAMHLKYPLALPRSQNCYPWAVFTDALSLNMRNARKRSKLKADFRSESPVEGALPCATTTSDSAMEPQAKSSRRSREVNAYEDIEQCFRELQMEGVKPNLGVAHVKQLLAVTRRYRTTYLLGHPMLLPEDILNWMAAFTNIKVVTLEFNETVIELKVVVEKLRRLLEAVCACEGVAGAPDEENTHEYNLWVQNVLKSIPQTKNAAPVVVGKEDVAKAHPVCPTIVYGLVQLSRELPDITFIVGKKRMECSCNSMVWALAELIAMYFVMQVEYPPQFMGTLGILQQCCIKVPYAGLTSAQKKYCAALMKKKKPTPGDG